MPNMKQDPLDRDVRSFHLMKMSSNGENVRVAVTLYQLLMYCQIVYCRMLMKKSYDSGSLVLSESTNWNSPAVYIIGIRVQTEMLIGHLTIITARQNCTAISMEQSLYEANSSSASNKVPCLSWK